MCLISVKTLFIENLYIIFIKFLVYKFGSSRNFLRYKESISKFLKTISEFKNIDIFMNISKYFYSSK